MNKPDFGSLKHLKCDFKNHQLWITLDRPDSANAFHLPMIDELVSTLEKADHHDEVRVIVITGSGKNFCAGGDVVAMKEKKEMFSGESDELRRNYQKGIQRIPRAMEQLQKPTLALVNGAAIGAGCDFACMCDLRIGSHSTKMGETFTKLALVPGDGGTYFLPRVVGYTKAMEMFLTGKIYRGEECFKMGLLNEYVEDEELTKKGEELANLISSNAPTAIQMTKKALKVSYLKDLQTSLDLLAAFQGITQRTEDHFEGLKALQEKRSPSFSGN
ncbi:MAG: enoyl-CoA hydratase-related protein [Halobacteriovoraceae bacterium]|nr:enoyl-CoA hydratase-related protein [Halobacteriovoraceae bacterium]